MKILAFVALVMVSIKAMCVDIPDLWGFLFVDPSSPLAVAPIADDAADEHEVPPPSHKKQRQGAAPDDGDEEPAVEASSELIVFPSASKEVQEMIKAKAFEVYASGAHKNWGDLARQATEGTNVRLLGKRARAWVDPDYAKTLHAIQKKSDDKDRVGKIKFSEEDEATQEAIKAKAREIYASAAYKDWADLARKVVEDTNVQPPKYQHIRSWVDEEYAKKHREQQKGHNARWAAKKRGIE